MHRPGLGLRGVREDLCGAHAQDAEVLIDHLSGLPAGPAAKPVHTEGHERREKTGHVHLCSIADSAARTLLGCFFTPRPVL